MIVTIRNIGTNPRVVHDAKGRPHRLLPGTSRDLELDDTAVARIQQRYSAVLDIANVGMQVKKAAPAKPAKPAVGEKGAEVFDPRKADDAPMTAAKALALSSGPFFTFRSAAKEVLGDDCPKAKADMIAALEAKAAE